jgi:hypothetical protein
MLKLFDTKDLLKHIEKLFLGEDAFTVEGLHSGRSFVLIVTWEDKLNFS